MIKETVTLNEVIDFLNELVEVDAPAVAALIANRVPCNEQLADHPTVQCGAQHGGFHVGMLGILNGLFGIHEGEYRNGWGAITAVFDDNDKGHFRNLVRFERVQFEPSEPESDTAV